MPATYLIEWAMPVVGHEMGAQEWVPDDPHFHGMVHDGFWRVVQRVAAPQPKSVARSSRKTEEQPADEPAEEPVEDGANADDPS
jgi:hypothetical protein